MKLDDMLPFRMAICGLALLAVSVAADDLSTKYCSSQNTGSSAGPYYNIYNSMGACSTKCQSQYAFAVVQGKNCWCSNYIPADQSSTSECNSQCPGYPSDLCGNPGQGLYGYVALAKAPSGTAGASGGPSTSSSSTTKTPTSEVSLAVIKTVTEEQSPSPSVVVSYVTPSPSSLPPSSSPPSTSTATTTTKSLVVTEVTRISGTVVTQTVTNTPIGVAPNNESPNRPLMEKTGLSDGAIAGAVIGTILGVAAIALAVYFLWWRRRRSADPEGGSSGSPKRKGSVLSRAGLLGGGRPQSMSENNYDDQHGADPITRSNSVRHSMMFGAGASSEGVAPSGPLGTSSDSGSGDNRLSKPMVYDQRLNPTALWVHHDNGSRTSMQDQQDYSRPLGVANPDPTRSYSFDSR